MTDIDVMDSAYDIQILDVASPTSSTLDTRLQRRATAIRIDHFLTAAPSRVFLYEKKNEGSLRAASCRRYRGFLGEFTRDPTWVSAMSMSIYDAGELGWHLGVPLCEADSRHIISLIAIYVAILRLITTSSRRSQSDPQ
jgi:hypothetical protein